MAFDLFIIPNAEKDIEDAVLWYNEIDVNLAERFLNELHYFFENIFNNPEVYRTRIKNLKLANLDVFPYQVVYRINADKIEIIAVFHSKRDPKIWKKRNTSK